VPTLDVAGKVFPVQECFLEHAASCIDLSGAMVPKRKGGPPGGGPMSRSNSSNNLGRDAPEEDGPELSKKLLTAAAGRDPRVGQVLMGTYTYTCTRADQNPCCRLGPPLPTLLFQPFIIHTPVRL
jgi:hypothetical protein